MAATPRRLRRSVLAATVATMLAVGGAGMSVSSAQPARAWPAPAAAPPASPAVAVEDPTAVRLGGADRYRTAARVATQYASGTEVAYVASGTTFADALTARDAGALSAQRTDAHGERVRDRDDQGPGAAPVLLTRPDALPEATARALAELDPDTIRIVGGEAAVSTAVAEELAALGDVERIGGRDRYATAALVAEQFPQDLPVVFVATGEDFPDALTGGAVAGRSQAPVLLTRGGGLPRATADALSRLTPRSVVVLGGPAAVAEKVVEEITAIVPDTTRIAGADRYRTAALVAAAYEADPQRVHVATGERFPDALAGSALAGHEGVPLLLTRTAALPGSTRTALAELSPQGLVILGGERAVSRDVEDQLNRSLPGWADQVVLQLLSFNDYHGHLETEGGTLTREQDPEQHLVGGAENLSTTLSMLRTRSFADRSLTVAAGDLIGGSTFLSGIFHDEPSVESLNLMGLDISGVGNHEFDEGVEELLRMQRGGCHPDDGCYLPDQPYAGAEFQWLAANVVDRETREPVLPATEVRDVAGVPVGFVGMTLEATPTLVSPAGVASVDFLDEVETANAQAVALREQGVEAIVVLLHEGGYQEGTYDDCVGISGPVVEIAQRLDPAIDAVVTGHTHQPYVCTIEDPAGRPRTVTSANQYGRVVTETALPLSRRAGDVARESVQARNHLVLEEVRDDPEMTALLQKWQALSEVRAAEVVGTVAEDITGDAGGDRGVETPMADLVADAILSGTDGPDEGGAQISFMNVGGVRASLLVDQISNGEEPGEVTYEEAYNVAPFGNILVSVDLTGAQVKAVLEQQYDPGRDRQTLALGVSEGFGYTWDDTQPQGSRVSAMTLDGEPLEDETVYRVSTLNFLQEGGDSFTAFTEGTNLQGGPEDLANLVAYLQANPGLTAPEDRVAGL